MIPGWNHHRIDSQRLLICRFSKNPLGDQGRKHKENKVFHVFVILQPQT